MEDVPLCRENKFVCNRGNNGRDREEAVVMGMEFDRRVLMETEVFALEPDLITNGVLIRSDVSGPFLMGDKEGRGQVRVELGKFKEMVGDSGGRGGWSGKGE